MKVYERLCTRDWIITAENGDHLELKRGKGYTTSDTLPDGTLIVYSSYWVRVPVSVFEPSSEERP